MKNIKFSVYIPVILAITLVAGIFIGNRLTRNSGNSMPLMSKSNKLDAILDLIQSAYVDSISTDTLVEKTIPQLLKNLDPHTAYIPAKEMVGVEEEMRGNFGGIGVQFSIQSDTVMVVDVISGGPSSKLGILPGDRIVTVNDTLLAEKGLKNEKVLSKLRGEKGTKVNVGIKRKGFKDLFAFEIIRGDIPIYSVDVSYMIDATTGYIKVSRFGEQTYEEFVAGMKKLTQQGMKNMTQSLQNRSVIVTGASKGIGKGIARVMAQAGARVAIMARYLDRADAAAKEIGHGAFGVEGDVTSAASLEKAFAFVYSTQQRYFLLRISESGPESLG